MTNNEKIEALRKKIQAEKAQLTRPDDASPHKYAAGGTSLGFEAVSQMVASTFVGTLIGLGFDKVLGMWPLFSIIFCFLGIAAGVVAVFRMSKNKKP